MYLRVAWKHRQDSWANLSLLIRFLRSGCLRGSLLCRHRLSLRFLLAVVRVILFTVCLGAAGASSGGGPERTIQFVLVLPTVLPFVVLDTHSVERLYLIPALILVKYQKLLTVYESALCIWKVMTCVVNVQPVWFFPHGTYGL